MTTRSTTTDDGAVTPVTADSPADAAETPSPDRAQTKVTRPRVTTAGRAAVPVFPAEEPTRADRIEISQGGIYAAEAGSISLQQGGMSMATADSIDITQGGIGRARAGEIMVTQGGVGIAQADKVSVERGLVGAAFGEETHVIQSMAQTVVGNEASVDQSLVGTIVGGTVSVQRPSAIGILIAGRVEGTVRPLLDWRGAAAFGAVFAVVLGIVRRGRRA